MFKISNFLILISISLCLCDELYNDCIDTNSYNCVEKSLVKYVDSLDVQENVPIFGDYVTLSKNEETFETPREEEGFMERSARFLANREIKLKLTSDAAKGLIEGARSSKIKKILLPLLVLFKLKAVIVFTIVLAVIAMISFKGLGASLIALAIAGATGFKSLLDNHGAGKISYEVLPSIPSSHWNRIGMMDSSSQAYPSYPSYPSAQYS